MRLKKKVKIQLFMAIIIFSFSFSISSNVFAATEEDVIDFIKQPYEINGTTQYIKDDYVVRIERFFGSHKYSPEEYDIILALMKEVLEIMKEEGRNDPTAMSWQAEHRVLRLIYEGAKTARITVKYGKANLSNGYLAFYEFDGSKIDEIYYTENSFKVTGIGLWFILGIGFALLITGICLRNYRNKLFA